jgi:ABC-type phosphate transport system permease subunit
MLFVMITGWSAIVLLNVFWLVWGFLYDGPLRRFVRSLWWVYAAVPFVVGGAFALSILRSPLRAAPEPFSSDWRPIAYFAAALCAASLLAVVGVITLSRRSAWNASSGAKV